MNYLQFDFETTDTHQSDQLIALLNLQGFEGFEEDGQSLKAFIPEGKFREDSFKEIEDFFSTLVYTRSVIEQTNWNKKWEEDFEPVKVDDFVAIRAHFHEPVEGVEHEIIITPKMSFGTGHHATTFLMVQEMRQLSFEKKAVLDFGTGTGVLAILAEKLGAEKILAIDNDEWSITNSKENIEQNDCSRIILSKMDKLPDNQIFDIVLANINLNVIVDSLASVKRAAAPSGKILFSGILKENEERLKEEIGNAGLKFICTKQKSNWILILAEN